MYDPANPSATVNGSTTGLQAGTYKLWAVDQAGNFLPDGAPYQSISSVAVLDGYTIGTSSGTNGVVGGITVNGWNLINPVTVSGKTYYAVDVNGDGVISSTNDRLAHDQLDALFHGGSDTTAAQRTDASASNSLLRGHDVVLPPQAELTAIWNSLGALPSGWGNTNTTWAGDLGTGGAEHHKVTNLATGTVFSNTVDTNLNYAVFQVI